MQGYSKVRLGPFMPVNFSGEEVASKHGNSKGSLAPFIPFDFNVELEA
jgi:hypothetical protein